MSLREEICGELLLLDALDQFTKEEMKPNADRILKLIEKRIDSIKNENTPKIAAYTFMSDSDKCLFTGYHKALEDVKELLK